MEPRQPARAAAALALALAVTVCILQAGPVPAGGAAVPTPDQILNRVLAAQAHAPATASADAALKLRIHKPVAAAPDCEFRGTLQIEGGRQTLTVNQGGSSAMCWVANRMAVGQLFVSSQPLEAVLAQFNFQVTGEREVDGRRYYLVQGTARNPSDNVKSLTAWVDYDRGLVTSGTVEYGWGRLDAEQRFTRMNETWILTHQYLYTPKFDASLEIDYTNFRLGPGR